MSEGTHDFHGYKQSVTTGPDGKFRAVYLGFSDQAVARTEEVLENLLLVDFNAAGEILGIEILGPVPMEIIKPLVDRGFGQGVERYMRYLADAQLVA